MRDLQTKNTNRIQQVKSDSSRISTYLSGFGHDSHQKWPAIFVAYSGWLAETIAIGRHGLIWFDSFSWANCQQNPNEEQLSQVLGGSPVMLWLPPSPLRATERPPWQK